MDPLFPFQAEGIDAIVARERYGLHDEMGLGKTVQIIRAVNRINSNGNCRGIVVCPAKLRTNWCKEFRKWSTAPYKVCNGQTIHDFVAWTKGRFQILVTSYEQMTSWGKYAFKNGELLDFVALDEGHYVKNSAAKRTRAILGTNLDCAGAFTQWSEYVWHVSGTPMMNDPLDIYTFLRMCNATTLSESQFIRRYFYAEEGEHGIRTTIRPEMLPEITYVIENNRIRRTKAGVGLQLPPIFLSNIVVDGDTSQIKKLLSEHPGLERTILDALERGGLSQLDAPHIMTLRRLLGEAKSIPYAHLLMDEFRISPEKRVTFGVHVQALKNVSGILNNHRIPSVMVRGEMSDREAQANIEAFQDDPRVLHMSGNIRSAGLGSNLVSAHYLDLMESEWSPGANKQAMDRVHRIGQHHNVFVRLVTLANSFDERVNEIVERKLRAIADIEGERMIPEVNNVDYDLTSIL